VAWWFASRQVQIRGKHIRANGLRQSRSVLSGIGTEAMVDLSHCFRTCESGSLVIHVA
jgi:hypothetical protein